MKKFTKILSVLCALALIASCISVGFVASAAEATVSITAKETFDARTDYSDYGTNHLASASVSAKATEVIDGTPTSAGSWTPGAGLVDNSPAAQQMIQVTWPSGTTNGATDTTSTNQYLDYTFSLAGAVNNPETVVLAFVQTGTSINWNNTFFESRHYAVYASDSADTLYTGDPIFYRQTSGNTGPEHIIDISGLEIKNVKYLGVRVYNFYFWGNTVLFSEIGLYGGKSILADNATWSVDADNNYNLGANRLAGSTATTTGVDNGAEWAISKGADVAILTDGSIASRNQIQASGWDNSYSFSKASTSKYIQVEFALSKAVNNPTKFLMAHDMASYASNLTVNQWYEVFASNSKDDLYSKSIFVYKNSAAKMPEQIVDLSGMNLGEVKYLAIRYYHTPTGVFALPSEIGLYGGKTEFEVKSAFSSDTNSDYTSVYGGNRLTGSTLTSSIVETEGATFSHSPDATKLTDNLSSTVNQIQISSAIGSSATDYTQTAEYVELKFALTRAVTNPESFMIAYRLGSDESLMHYSIFASETEANLFSSAVYTHSSSSNDGQENHIDLSTKNLGKVKYFAIRMYNMPVWGTCVIPAEIALYGGEVEKLAVLSATKTSAISDYSAHGTNHLKSATGFGLAINGTESALANTDAFFVDGEILNSTSSTSYMSSKDDSLGSADNSTTQTTAYFQLEYELNGAVDLPKKVVFSPHYTANTSNGSQHYAIYMSASEDTLYDKAIYEYSGTGTYTEHTIDISELELEDIKYFAVRFYHRNYTKYQFISEIGLYGGTMETGASKVSTSAKYILNGLSSNFLADKDATLVSVSPSGNVAAIDTAADLLAGYTDGLTSDKNAGAKWDSNVGTGGYFQITYDLGGTLDNPEAFRLQVAQYAINERGYSIYASDSLDTLYDNKIVERSTFDGAYTQLVHNVEDCNLKGIKYIGLRVTSYNNIVQITEFSVDGGTYTADSLKLSASVYNSNSGSNSNDIIYWVDASDFSGEITDMGIISGFKMNIDADSAFTGDYAEFLKANSSTSIAKVSAPSDVLGAEDLFFQVLNSGTHNDTDYSGYIVSTIAFVTVKGIDGTETTYYSNVITKSSMQISRNQAKAYKEAGYVVEGYESYEFATDGTIDIAKVREYVEACTAQDLSKKNSQ